MAENKEKILSVKNLKINFKTDNGLVHAVRGVSFDLYRGETLCIVGESGSGKSVTNKAIMGILAANAIIADGQILYEGEDLVRVSEEDFHRIRGKKIGMIFQDPLSALNPLVKVGKQIIETSMINKNVLKRKYHDLIGDDLTALRNVEASTFYDIHKLTNTKLENEKNLKTYKANTKKLQPGAKRFFFFNYKEEKLAEIQEETTKLLEKMRDNNSMFVRSSRLEVTSLEEQKAKNEKRIAHYEQDEQDVRNNVPKSLRIEKRVLRNQGIDRQLELFNEIFKELEAVTDTIDQTLLINEFVAKRIEALKLSLKEQKKVLKEILSLTKKYAHAEVDAYKAEIKAEHEAKLNELNANLLEAKTKLSEYLASLAPEESEKLLATQKENAKLLKKKEKIAAQTADKSISKTTHDGIELIKIDDETFVALNEEIAKIEKAIELENQDYVNKTVLTRKEAKRMALEVMREVGIPMPERRFKQYPFEFSGGMRQRIVIAIALIANPEILICDEPTTALDVTIQAQILELINKLKAERNLSCIFITHDLGVVANMADRVAVMYAGKIVEYGNVEEIFFDPRHPYTWALLSSIPDINSKEKLEAIPGTPPDMLFPPKGDAFALRSKYAMNIDFKYEPPFFKVTDTHYAATWLLYPGAPKVEMPKIVKDRIKNSLKEKEATTND